MLLILGLRSGGADSQFYESYKLGMVTAVEKWVGRSDWEGAGLSPRKPQSPILRMRRTELWEEGGVREEGPGHRERVVGRPWGGEVWETV